MDAGSGCNRVLFLAAKLVTRREGTPAVMLQWAATRAVISLGKAVVEGRISRMSQAVLRARRCSVESFVGRIIQRITREITRGFSVLDCRVERNVERGFGVVVCRARRWRVQSGIVAVGAGARIVSLGMSSCFGPGV